MASTTASDSDIDSMTVISEPVSTVRRFLSVNDRQRSFMSATFRPLCLEMDKAHAYDYCDLDIRQKAMVSVYVKQLESAVKNMATHVKSHIGVAGTNEPDRVMFMRSTGGNTSAKLPGCRFACVLFLGSCSSTARLWLRSSTRHFIASPGQALLVEERQFHPGHATFNFHHTSKPFVGESIAVVLLWGCVTVYDPPPDNVFAAVGDVIDQIISQRSPISVC
jgi:hypothetical protein